MDPSPQKGKIQIQLLRWFKKKRRDLPWRKTQDPYAIWVSEIMLQQTQVSTVIPYYQEFLRSFPTISHLSKADLSKVLKAWEGLGYYSRARNLHRASQIVANHFTGRVPDSIRDLLSLPGIGRSTAGAILSFAYNREAPILDGNVKRILCRLFAISGNPVRVETEGLLWGISESLIPKGHSNQFNQALMDLGSMLCTPTDPQCSNCPLRSHCKGKASGDPERYPTKGSKKRIPHINAVSAVIQRDGKVLLHRRPLEGLLGGLWEFPNWPLNEREKWTDLLVSQVKNKIGLRVKIKRPLGPFHQTFSHFKLTLHVYHCQLVNGEVKGKWVSLENLSLFPMSSVHRRIANLIGEGIG